MKANEIKELLDETEGKIWSKKLTREEALMDLNKKILWSSNSWTSYLIDNLNFTRIPASIAYHGNYTGGLFDHSLRVAKKICELTDKFELSWKLPRSPFLVGMYHDICKVSSYDAKAVYDEDGGEQSVLAWEHRTFKSPYPGHGVRSVILLDESGINLTRQERICILHHMGAYEKDMWAEFDSAIKEDQNVLWTHTADMYVSKVLGF